jgi:hypothetical protein
MHMVHEQSCHDGQAKVFLKRLWAVVNISLLLHVCLLLSRYMGYCSCVSVSPLMVELPLGVARFDSTYDRPKRCT